MAKIDASEASIKHRPSAPWCGECPLRQCSEFVDFSGPDLAFMERFKVDHSHAWAGEVVYEQGSPVKRLFTLFSGWAARFRTLHSGERQLLAILLPGDLVGLETVLTSAPRHSIEALTDINFCVFDPDRIDELLAVPSLSKRIAWYLLLDRRHAERRMAAIGACDARRSLADFAYDLYVRLEQRALVKGPSFFLPMTHRQLASALGLTPVHVYRTLRGLEQEGLLTLEDGRLTIHDLDRLRDAACMSGVEHERRPLI